MSTGEVSVIGRRFDALADAIRSRDWGQVEFLFDQTRSAVDRYTGQRERAYDGDPNLGKLPAKPNPGLVN